MKKFEKEKTHKEKLIRKFLKNNADKGFTAKELYDQFTWDLNDHEVFMEILEKLLTEHSFRIFGDNKHNYITLHNDFIKEGLEGDGYIYYYKFSILQLFLRL